MSRTGKLPIKVPSTVKLSVENNTVFVEGPKGKLNKAFNPAVSFSLLENMFWVKPANDSLFSRVMQGTARSIIAAMVKGVQELYVKDLELQGTGFKAVLKGDHLDLSLGYSHPILHRIPKGLIVHVTDGGTKIKVEGADKHMVGQLAAEVKHYYPVEPYKGKGVRILGQFVRRKEGKKTA